MRCSNQNRILPTAFFTATLLILVGCAGRVRYPNYYTLDLPAPADPPSTENVRATLAVREFRAPTYLRHGAIVYKTSPEQIGFYEYHRWATDPRDFVTNAIIDRLRNNGIFAHVKAYDGTREVDCVLSGRLEKLEEIDYAGRVKVQVAISAAMTSIATGATVWSNSVSETGDVNGRDVPAVVSAMNSATEGAIEKLLSTMSAEVASRATATKRD